MSKDFSVLSHLSKIRTAYLRTKQELEAKADRIFMRAFRVEPHEGVAFISEANFEDLKSVLTQLFLKPFGTTEGEHAEYNAVHDGIATFIRPLISTLIFLIAWPLAPIVLPIVTAALAIFLVKTLVEYGVYRLSGNEAYLAAANASSETARSILKFDLQILFALLNPFIEALSFLTRSCATVHKAYKESQKDASQENPEPDALKHPGSLYANAGDQGLFPPAKDAPSDAPFPNLMGLLNASPNPSQ